MKKPENTNTARIRKLFQRNPKAGMDDLREEFGELTPSIQATYYTIRHKLYGPVRTQNIRKMVHEYRQEHPGKTHREIGIALGLTKQQVRDAVAGLNKKERAHHKDKIIDRVRKIFAANPNAGYADLEKEFGTLNSSLKTAYKKIYVEIYGTTPFRRTNVLKKAIAYYKEHPRATIKEGAEFLGITYPHARSIVQRVREHGVPVINTPHQKENPDRIINRIQEYMLAHPNASIRECAEHLGTKLLTTITYVHKLRTEGILPYKLDSFTRDRMKKKPAPIIVIPKETDEDMLYDWGVIAV